MDFLSDFMSFKTNNWTEINKADGLAECQQKRTLTLAVTFYLHCYSCDSLVLFSTVFSMDFFIFFFFYCISLLLEALVLHDCLAFDQLLCRQCKLPPHWLVSHAWNWEDNSVCLLNFQSLFGSYHQMCQFDNSGACLLLYGCVLTMNEISTTCCFS